MSQETDDIFRQAVLDSDIIIKEKVIGGRFIVFKLTTYDAPPIIVAKGEANGVVIGLLTGAILRGAASSYVSVAEFGLLYNGTEGEVLSEERYEKAEYLKDMVNQKWRERIREAEQKGEVTPFNRGERKPPRKRR